MDSLHRTSKQRPLENNDPRIPMAWRHREMTFNNPYTHRPSSPSITSTSSDDREEVPIVRQHYRPLSRHSNIERPDDRMDHYATIRSERMPEGFNRNHDHQFLSARNDRMEFNRPSHPADFFHGPYRNHPNGSTTGTLRSTRSVPALAFAAALETQDPCPIHGNNHGPMRRHGSLFDIRAPPVGGPLGLSAMEKKNFHGSKHSLINGNTNLHSPAPHFHAFQEPPQYLPPHLNPLMRPPHHMGMMIDPMHLRDPFNKTGNLHRNGAHIYPTKEPVDPYSVEQVCCKGHLIVLWIILGVVTVGVILGIIMGVTIT